MLEAIDCLFMHTLITSKIVIRYDINMYMYNVREVYLNV